LRSLGCVIVCAGALLASAGPLRAAPTEATEDELTLQKARAPTDGAGLLAFFRQRTLTGDYPKRIEALVKQLGDDSAKARKRARQELIALGPPALPALRRALKSPEDVVQVLARECVHVLEKDPGPNLPLAAVRLLRERRPAGACPVLLGYLPFADNQAVEEETLEALVALGTQNGRTDPALLAALKDRDPVRRGGAAYAVGRIGLLDERAAVRERLGDAEARVRVRAGEGLVGREIYESARRSAAADEKLLGSQKIPATAAGLLTFFRKRTLSEETQRRLREWVRQLGSSSYKEREKAESDLKQYGSAALPYLRPALKDPDVEVNRRAGRCIRHILSGPATALPAAAVRLLTLRAPDKAVDVLLAYAPFADDEMVEEEVEHALQVLSTRAVTVPPALAAALKDRAPARRGLAASVLGHVGTRADLSAVRKLLADPEPTVRYQAAYAFLAARDRAAVPVLVALLDDGPVDLARKAEDLLTGVSGRAVGKTELTEKQADRRKVRLAWSDWWQAQRDKIDMTRINLDSELAKETRARQVSIECLSALLRLDAAGFKKRLQFPFFMQMGPGQDEIRSGEQLDQFFKMIEMQAGQLKEEFKKMKFKIKGVAKVEDFLGAAKDKKRPYLDQMRVREDRFLKKFPKREVLIVRISVVSEGRMQGGGDGAVFVRVAGGRAWVIGFGQARGEEKMMAKTKP
jgi:HEAT repeat protein